ncbi:MAG: STAS domain-containing protein [Streptomycetaceae bacterium]|jgi:anti-sigma B factor antagonist|nr:STAS domain-containing protein [Streptomycetaceae bacterium]
MVIALPYALMTAAPHRARDRGAAVVAAKGEIDLATAEALRNRITAALETHREVAVDLSAVTFIDCSGLRVLITARNQADRLGRSLTLRDPSRPVRRLLAATRLDHTLRTRTQPPSPP